MRGTSGHPNRSWRAARPGGLAAFLGAALLFGSTAWVGPAAEARDAGGADKKIVASAFRPQAEAVPKGGRSGATRGLTIKSKTRGVVRNMIWPVAPPGVGLTADASPVLYWYSTGRISGPAYLRIEADGAKDPILDVTLVDGAEPGFNEADLGDYGLRLQPGRVYKWYLILAPLAAEGGPADTVGGQVRFVPASTTDAIELAASGYWYDTFHAVSGDTEAMVIMLEQADLDDLARKLRASS
jgi:hypothetical protein